MALCGRINGTVTNKSAYFSFYIEWSAKQNYEENYSEVTVRTYWETNNTSHAFNTVGERPASITINGKTTSISKVFPVYWDTNPYLIQEVTEKIYHNDLGARSITISARANGYVLNDKGVLVGPSLYLVESGDCTAYSTVTLDTIPKKAIVTDADNFTDESNPTITFINTGNYSVAPFINVYAYKGLTKELVWSITREKDKYESPYTFSITDEERTELREACCNDDKYEAWLGVQTYKGDADLKDSQLLRILSIVNANPSTTMTLTPVGCPDWVKDELDGEEIFIQGKTKVGATFNNDLKKGATLKSNTLIVEGYSDSSSSYESKPIVSAGTVNVSGKVTDSRGATGTTSQDIEVYPYSIPSICYHSQRDRIICKRCDEKGNLSEEGTYIKLEIGARWSPLKENVNKPQFWYGIMAEGYDTGWLKLKNYPIGTDGKWDIEVILQDAEGEKIVIDVDKAYTVWLCVMDDFESESYWHTEKIPMSEVTFHLREGGMGAAFGEYANEPKVLKLQKDWEFKLKDTTIDKYVLGLMGDYVVEVGSQDYWEYRKWNSGKIELWREIALGNQRFSYKYRDGVYLADSSGGSLKRVAIPSGLIFKYQDGGIPKTCALCCARGNSYIQSEIDDVDVNGNGVWYRIWTPFETEVSQVRVSLYISSWWKV